MPRKSKKPGHVCNTGSLDGECIEGSLYDDQVRVPRPFCPCSCHLLPGEKRK